MSDYIDEIKAKGKTCIDCNLYDTCDVDGELCELFESDDINWRWQISYGECLRSVLHDYGIDTSHFTEKVMKHMVEDFMDLMVKQGHVTDKRRENESNS